MITCQNKHIRPCSVHTNAEYHRKRERETRATQPPHMMGASHVWNPKFVLRISNLISCNTMWQRHARWMKASAFDKWQKRFWVTSFSASSICFLGGVGGRIIIMLSFSLSLCGIYAFNTPTRRTSARIKPPKCMCKCGSLPCCHKMAIYQLWPPDRSFAVAIFDVPDYDNSSNSNVNFVLYRIEIHSQC